jgi:hypothetical protein
MSVIPDTQEAKVRGSQSETGLGKKHKTLSKSKLERAGGMESSGRAQVQSLNLSAAKKKN